MISAYGLCAGGRVGFGLAIGYTTVGVLHRKALLRQASMPVGLTDFQDLPGHAVEDFPLGMRWDCL